MELKNSALYKILRKCANYAIQLVASRQNVWAGTEEMLLAKKLSFTPALPVNIYELPADLASYFYESIALPKVMLYYLCRVSISWHMVVFRNLRIFLPALAHPREQKHYSGTYLLQQWRGKLVVPPADGVELALVHNQWTSSNYYHWMVDALPRLLLLQADHSHCRLLMTAPVPAFVRDSAAMLGFTDLFTLEAGQTMVGADLLVPGHVTAPGYQHPDLLLQVRQQIFSKVYPSGEPLVPHRRIYASRRSQRVRRLLNEQAIEELLVQYGYEVVEFEEMTFSEQVRLMAETSLFISVHGAGLTNMLFLPSGARVGELMNMDKIILKQNQDFENLIYFRMAAALQLPYYCLPCANVGDDVPTNEADLQVDATAFERLLSLMSF